MLKLQYQDDTLNEAINTKREYQITDSSRGNKNIVDVTTYEKQGEDFGAAELKEIVRTLYGFKNSKVVFNEDGSITETSDVGVTTTVFNEDGSITATLVDKEGNKIIRLTQFDEDGSIVNTVSDVITAEEGA